MTFLALTPLQAALLAALTAGAIIALYFLKLRHRRVFVSSSILWRKVLDERQAHSLWEKLRKIISIAVAVTIALLIAMALGRPEIESLTGRTERIVIVMDTSPTMYTRTSDGRTRWDHAVPEALGLLDSGGATTEFRVVDTAGNTASAFTTDRSQLRDLIQQMSPKSGQPQFPNVDARDSVVYLVSDGVAVQVVPGFAKRISVFEPAENVGITAFEIRSIPSTPLAYEAYIEIQNYGKEMTELSLTVSGTGGQRITRTMRLGAGEVVKDTLDLTRFEGGGVRAAIQAKDDALQTDDIAFAYLPIKRKTRTLLVTRGNHYLETILKLDNYVDLTMTDPARYREAPTIDAYIFDRFAPPKAPPRPALIIGTPAAPWLKPAGGVVLKPEITTWSEDHPVMQYVSVHDISIDRASRIDPANLTVVAGSRDVPLIVVSDKPKWVMLTFELDATDFPLQVGFPVFIENVLTWFSREQLALQRAPGIVDVPFSNAQIRTMDGQTVPSEQQLGKTLFNAPEPGLYAVNHGDNRVHVAVNLANRTFSDVNRSVFQGDRIAVSEQRLLRRELWFYMLLLASVLISIEWFTYHRRITL
ncbi:MAG: VWA domain-containing protein [Acidobacteria bacterium]|nr:VWA domain-containing protein [Acidobacteriota bacterium]